MSIKVRDLIGCAGLSAAMLMGACQTTGTTDVAGVQDGAKAAATTAALDAAADAAGAINPLYSGLSLNTALGITRSADSSVCTQFYKNAAAAAAVEVPSSGGGFGMGLLKTMGLGILSGAAAGGVGALGIGSSFLELAVSNTASQVVYQGGSAALEGATGGGASGVSSEALETAETLGCPAPTAASLTQATGEHSHTHTHN